MIKNIKTGKKTEPKESKIEDSKENKEEDNTKSIKDMIITIKDREIMITDKEIMITSKGIMITNKKPKIVIIKINQEIKATKRNPIMIEIIITGEEDMDIIMIENIIMIEITIRHKKIRLMKEPKRNIIRRMNKNINLSKIIPKIKILNNLTKILI